VISEKWTQDYVRHGTTILFVAPAGATGKVTDACFAHHCYQDFSSSSKQVTETYPRVKVHLVSSLSIRWRSR
jgi:hypothetical protein